MLKSLVLLWVAALGVSSVGFVALVVGQSLAGLLRSARRSAHPALAADPRPGPAPAVLVSRAEKALQMPEPLAG